MAKLSNNVWVRVGIEPEARLRWLLNFGNLNPDSLTAAQRSAVLQEARVFVGLQEVDPALRDRMRYLPPPTDATPDVLTLREAWSAQTWLKEGLDLLSRSEKWNFVAVHHVRARRLQGVVLDTHEGDFAFAAIQSVGI